MNTILYKRISKLRLNGDEKGFVLAELVIVLVIIVLLLAILIPVVTNYVDDAKENAERSEARAVKVAIQTIINEDYIDENINSLVVHMGHKNYGLSEEGQARVEKLLEMNVGRVDNIKIDENNVLSKFTYLTLNGSKVRYDSDKYIIEYIY